MSVASVVPATITRVDSPSVTIQCMFNPKEYTFTKQNSWQPAKTKGSNVPPLEFTSGNPATLQMQLFFDTYSTGEDVRSKYTDPIWELMMVDNSLINKKSKKGRPPQVRFQWGEAWSFLAVISNITQKFTLFKDDGTPLRATLDVTFQQVKDAKLFPSQNPTSGGPGGGRVWTVKEGDTLAWIAYKELGDATVWREIADANHLSRVRKLRPGMMLEIPNG
jgi:hypothetical protein